jgi:hypothetical protein
MNALSRAALALAIAAPCMAQADTASDLQSLRDEVAHMRADYESRIQSLETRLKAAEAAQTAAPANTAAAPSAAAPATAVAAPAPPSVAATGPAGGAGGGGGFNPAVSLILSGTYSRTSNDPASYRLRGFPLPPDAQAGPGVSGFSLGESELGIAASVDPWFSGAANIAFEPDNSVSVEEAFFQTTALGHGLTVKGGRFLSSIGYLNSQHAHTWDFVDAPLAYQGMLGGQFDDDGVDVAWLAPTDQFIELRGELGRGRSYPGTDTNRNGAGMAALIAHTGGDIGDSNSWRAGLSLLHTNAAAQPLSDVNAAGEGVTNAFSGSTRTWVADFIWKWAPHGNAIQRNFKLQGEYLQSTRDGSLTYDVAGANSTDAYRAKQSGWYLQGVYQFMPRWRFGLRTEAVDGGNASYGINGPFLLANEGTGHKNSVMVDYTLSEFSRLRLQFAHDTARFGEPDNQIWVQYQMSLGAHGAHSF